MRSSLSPFLTTPYNPVVIEQLKSFSYDSYAGMISIRSLLVLINKEVSIGRLPEIKVIRKLNEKCAEIFLFGSYAAGVFDAIQ